MLIGFSRVLIGFSDVLIGLESGRSGFVGLLGSRRPRRCINPFPSAGREAAHRLEGGSVQSGPDPKHRRCPVGPEPLVSAVHWQLGILIVQVFGRFSAKLGPKTPLERRGSSCSAGCTKNQPRRPIVRTFRGNSEF